MQETMENKAIEEMKNLSSKMASGYKLLQEVDEIDVATSPKELVWSDGKVKLFRYLNENIKVKTPVLITYALVNRFDMMDLQPDRSYIKNLLDSGLDLYIADWGYPTKADKYVTLDDYVEGYIGDMVDFMLKSTNSEKVSLMGICQGGTMATIYSALHPEKIKNLITLVTPIDFNTNEGLLFRWSRGLDIDKLVDFYGAIPGEFLNDGFAMLRPLSKSGKFLSLINSSENKDKLMNFLRMEKWINDSPNQAGECFRKFLKDLYQENKLVKGELDIEGKKVNLKNISMPVLNIYAEEDNLVPPSSTTPMGDYIGTTDYTLYNFKGGHIGVFVGNRSQKELAPAVFDWLQKRD